MKNLKYKIPKFRLPFLPTQPLNLVYESKIKILLTN